MAWTMFQQLLTLRKDLEESRRNWCKSKKILEKVRAEESARGTGITF